MATGIDPDRTTRYTLFAMDNVVMILINGRKHIMKTKAISLILFIG